MLREVHRINQLLDLSAVPLILTRRYRPLIRTLNDLCAPAGGGGNGPALRIKAKASLSNVAEPELFAMRARDTPPLADTVN
jgi:hypothetical protein